VFEKGLIVDCERWKGLQSIIKITATRETVEERFYISSLDVKKPFNQYIRSPRGVEISLHWTLDMVFREDGQRKRTGLAAENFAVIRKIALNLLKKDTGKESLRSKRLKAAWNKEYNAIGGVTLTKSVDIVFSTIRSLSIIFINHTLSEIKTLPNQEF
jgi:predicted transposase YbfD/YdcC